MGKPGANQSTDFKWASQQHWSQLGSAMFKLQRRRKIALEFRPGKCSFVRIHRSFPFFE
jgi:hypothetical protein